MKSPNDLFQMSPECVLFTCVAGKYDFGHYDVFNHYIRVDSAPYLFTVQGTPPGSVLA